MNTQSNQGAPAEYVRSQLLIAQSHEDSDVRNQARSRLLALCMQPLLCVARRLASSNRVHEDELMSEGVQSAMDTISKAELAKAECFFAYVCTRAKYRMLGYLSALRESRPLPEHAVKRLRRAEKACVGAHDAELLSDHTIAVRAGMRKSTVRLLRPFLRPDNVNEAMSLDDVPDQSTLSPLRRLEGENARQVVQSELSKAFEHLDSRHRVILEKHFGIGTDAALSQAEIAREIGVTAQRVQAIVSSALERLEIVLRKSSVLREINADSQISCHPTHYYDA